MSIAVCTTTGPLTSYRTPRGFNLNLNFCSDDAYFVLKTVGLFFM